MKQICIGLAISEDNIPFMHEVYEGNKHDSKIFPELLDALTERLTNLEITTEDMILVFDSLPRTSFWPLVFTSYYNLNKFFV